MLLIIIAKLFYKVFRKVISMYYEVFGVIFALVIFGIHTERDLSKKKSEDFFVVFLRSDTSQ